MASYRLSWKKTLLALMGFSVLVSLGCWQVQRLSWKEALLQKMDAGIHAAPIPLPASIPDITAFEYRPVTVRGHYLHDHEMLLKPRVENGHAGYHVVTPLREAAGRVVMIDRGFADDQSLKVFSRPSGVVTVTGVVTLPRKGSFTPENNPAKNDWYWADITAMTSSFKNAAPVLVTEGIFLPSIPNDHRQYAIFWFTMAAILVVVFILSERSAQKELKHD